MSLSDATPHRCRLRLSYSPPVSPTVPLDIDHAPEPDLCSCSLELDSKHHCWEVDLDVYGIIHSNDLGCGTCNSFSSHIHRSREQRVAGIEEAYSKMHSRHDAMWRRGLIEGAQREREAKDRALEKLSSVQIDLAKVEEELKCLTRLFLGQTSVTDFLSRVDKPSFATREDFQELDGDHCALWNDVVGVRQPLSPESLCQLSSESTPAQSTASLKHTEHTPSVATGPSYAEVARAPSLASSLNAASSPANDSSCPSHSRPGADIQGYYTSTFRSGVRASLTALFAASHDSDALAQCKALFEEARMTEYKKRTYGMNFVLRQKDRSSEPSTTSSSSALSSNQLNSRGQALGSCIGQASVMKNPRAKDPPEVWLRFLRIYRSNWPIGVREESNGDALLSDLRASRMLALMRPDNSLSRQQFITAVLSLFTNKGRYEELVARLGVRIASTERYRPFCTSPSSDIVSEQDVARHYASCGVTVKMVEENVEGWAVEYKREKETMLLSRCNGDDS